MAISSRVDRIPATRDATLSGPRTATGQGYRVPSPPRPPETEVPAPPGNLIVGEGIEISGEIEACDILVVEGRVDAKTFAAKQLDLRSSGVFHGGAKVENAVIAGTFEGSLSVSGTLSVTDHGVIRGEVSYGHLEIARGGKIIGDIEAMD